MTKLLFTTPTCPKCPAVKEMLKENNVEFKLIDASTTEGLDKARKYGVGSVPTLVVLDKEANMIDSANNIDAIESLILK